MLQTSPGTPGGLSSGNLGLRPSAAAAGRHPQRVGWAVPSRPLSPGLADPEVGPDLQPLEPASRSSASPQRVGRGAGALPPGPPRPRGSGGQGRGLLPERLTGQMRRDVSFPGCTAGRGWTSPDACGAPPARAGSPGSPGLAQRARPPPAAREGRWPRERRETSPRAGRARPPRPASPRPRRAASAPPTRLRSGPLPRPSSASPRAGGGQGRAGPRGGAHGPAGGTAEPGRADGAAGAGGGHGVGRARGSEPGRGGDRGRPRLEPARCAMELGDPGARPRPLLPLLLLLLGTGLLPGEFWVLPGPTFLARVPRGPGPPPPDQGGPQPRGRATGQPETRGVSCGGAEPAPGVNAPANAGRGVWVGRRDPEAPTWVDRRRGPSQPTPHPHPAKLACRPCRLACCWFRGPGGWPPCFSAPQGSQGQGPFQPPHPGQRLTIQGKWREWEPCVPLRRGHTFMVKGPGDKVCALGWECSVQGGGPTPGLQSPAQAVPDSQVSRAG